MPKHTKRINGDLMKKRSRITVIIILAFVLLGMIALFYPRKLGNKLKKFGQGSRFCVTDLPDANFPDQTTITIDLTEDQSEKLLEILSRCYVRPTLRADQGVWSGFFPLKREGLWMGLEITSNSLDDPMIFIETRNNINIRGIEYRVYNPSVIDEIVEFLEDVCWSSC